MENLVKSVSNSHQFVAANLITFASNFSTNGPPLHYISHGMWIRAIKVVEGRRTVDLIGRDKTVSWETRGMGKHDDPNSESTFPTSML